MKPSIIFTSCLALTQVTAHTIFTTLFVNNTSQGDGTCVRMAMTPGNATFPINELNSNDMACGRDGMGGVARVCAVDQGGKLSFLFRMYANGAANGSIDISHKGPCAVYMKAVSFPTLDYAVGPGWFKVWHGGYDESGSFWCTEKIINNQGFLSINLPHTLPGGYYLVRPEILSLHESDKTPPNPQFYVGCAQIFIRSAVMGSINETVSIPGYTNISDPAVLFNIYTPVWPYTPPGPTPLKPSQYGGIKNNVEMPTQNQGLLPKGVVMTNANWWGYELEAYTDENGCFNASKACFEQAKICYDTAPPTGSHKCGIWDGKCMLIQANCDSGNWIGPPSQGKDLNLLPGIVFSNIPPAENLASDFSIVTSQLESAGAEAYGSVGSIVRLVTSYSPLTRCSSTPPHATRKHPRRRTMFSPELSSTITSFSSASSLI